jgi:RNA polymerase sigma-70 factor (ECF subfamily)
VTTDAELLARSGSDAGAFRELYDRHSAGIHRFQLGRTRNREAAIDLTAETFAQAWLSRDRFRDLADGSAAPWLYAIARHVLVASVRKSELERSARERLGLLAAVDRAYVAPEPSEPWLDELDEALAELPTELQRAVHLRIVDDLSYEEVAETLGTTQGAARVRVHRGLSALRNRLLQTKEAAR